MKRTLLLTPLFGVVLLLGLAGCQTTPAGSTTAPPPLPPGGAVLLSPEAAAAGRALYVNKCARCHVFHDPAQYPDADWAMWMTKMSRKARLQTDERQLLNEFLGAYRSKAAGG